MVSIVSVLLLCLLFSGGGGMGGSSNGSGMGGGFNQNFTSDSMVSQRFSKLTPGGYQ